MSGDNAITAVSNMIEYCKAYINNKNTIISKIDDITSDNSDVKKESFIIFEANEQENKDEDKNESLSDNNKDDTKKEDNEQNNENQNKNDNKKQNNEDDNENKNDNNKNKQIGLNTFLTIIEQRYFDYIDILRSLFKK